MAPYYEKSHCYEVHNIQLGSSSLFQKILPSLTHSTPEGVLWCAEAKFYCLTYGVSMAGRRLVLPQTTKSLNSLSPGWPNTVFFWGGEGDLEQSHVFILGYCILQHLQTSSLPSLALFIHKIGQIIILTLREFFSKMIMHTNVG